MESFENRGCLCVFITVCDDPNKCVLNILQFSYVETGQTPEERVAVIKSTTLQGICRQDSSLSCQILSNPPELTHSNEACLTHIADMIRKGGISIKPDIGVLPFSVYSSHDRINLPAKMKPSYLVPRKH